MHVPEGAVEGNRDSGVGTPHTVALVGNTWYYRYSQETHIHETQRKAVYCRTARSAGGHYTALACQYKQQQGWNAYS